MSEYSMRLFEDDAAIVAIGEGLLARTLPRADWTHEAHLAACTWLVRNRPDIAIERALPAIISAYNEAVGGVNDDLLSHQPAQLRGDGGPPVGIAQDRTFGR